MTVNYSSEKYKQLASSHKIRASETNPLDLYLGRDQNGRPYLEYVGEAISKAEVKGTKAISVEQSESPENKVILRFKLLAEQSAENFYSFVNDMVQSSADISSQRSGYLFLINRFEAWKMIFGLNRGMAEKTIRGLLCELLFLDSYCFPKYGQERAIKGWSGPERTSKDFSFDDKWYEVKSTSNSSRKITISSFAQLDSSLPGNLIVYILDKRSEVGKGYSLVSLIEKIDASIDVLETKLLFRNRLLEYGYTFDKSTSIPEENTCYEVIERLSFKVNSEFPVIKRESIDNRISEIKYIIPISQIIDLKEDL